MLDWLKNLHGIGTELGIANSAIIALMATIGWLASRELARIKRKYEAIENRDLRTLIAEHDELYDEYEYKKRREESANRHTKA